MKKISILFLWLLIIASGIAGFFFAPLWVFTALALYMRFSMTDEGKKVDEALAQAVKEGGDAMLVGIDDWLRESTKKREAITFDDIHDAIHHLVYDKNPDQVSVWDWVYLRDDTQYNYLKSNQWLNQGGYYVYCDEQSKLHFGYDYQGIHWQVILHDDLHLCVVRGVDIPNKNNCYGRRCERLDQVNDVLKKRIRQIT